MIFTSYTYVAFLLCAFALHWLVPAKFRNGSLILLSYVFYCSWHWQFGFLLLGVSLFTYFFGGIVARREPSARLLTLGIAVELLPLVYFKYSKFLVANAIWLTDSLGAHWQLRLPNIILPLGISFFTFQGIAYLVDVATGETPFERMADFLLFKAFWPQLIAGPIIRPGEIRHQIMSQRRLDYAAVTEGVQRIAHGFFKKVVLADTIGQFVDTVFLPSVHAGAVDCVVGVLGFGLQIYFDFSGYSDIAIGTARLFGFSFPENFSLPYNSASPQEFWNRWHMSLSRWIRDYVFTPLSFSARRSPGLSYLWLVVAMAVCGLWHGAQWTFVLWGVWHGLLLLLGQTWLKALFVTNRKGIRSIKTLAATVLTFLCVTLGWALFRAESVQQAMEIVSTIVTMRGGLRPTVIRENAVLIVAAIFAGLLLYQAFQDKFRRLAQRLERDALFASAVRGTYFTAIVLAIIIFDREARAFVYFQF